jgi:DNA polymerase-3 subunit alpha (Gram-positive type)
MTDILRDEDFIKLEKEFKFLSRARAINGELESLSYIIVDLETTGLDPNSEEIIEIGAIKVEGKEVKDIFNKLVKPEKGVSDTITNITGITGEMLEHELPIKPVITQFSSFIGSSILIAHNSDFDVSFLRVNFKKWLNADINNPVVCTLLIARDILPNLDNHKLHTVAKYFGIEVANRHRAIGDAEVTYQIWLKLIDKLKGKNITTKKDLESYMASLKGTSAEAVPF